MKNLDLLSDLSSCHMCSLGIFSKLNSWWVSVGVIHQSARSHRFEFHSTGNSGFLSSNSSVSSIHLTSYSTSLIVHRHFTSRVLGRLEVQLLLKINSEYTSCLVYYVLCNLIRFKSKSQGPIYFFAFVLDQLR